MSSHAATGDAAGEIRHLVPDVETLAQRLAAVDYLVDEGLATSMYLSLRLPQPLLRDMQHARVRPRRLVGGQELRRGVRNGLELEGHDVDVVGEGGERLLVVVGGDALE